MDLIYNTLVKYKIYIYILLIILIIYIFYNKYNRSMTKSSVDGEEYDVLNRKDKQVASNKLAKLNNKIIELLRGLKNKYKTNLEENNNSYVFNILNNFKPDKIIETDPNNVMNLTSYTYSDGSVISFCVREKDYSFVDDDILTFVMIHEIAHQAKVVKDHGDEFWKIFKFLLINAEEFGIIKNINFAKYPVYYVGIKVDYSPYFDENINI